MKRRAVRRFIGTLLRHPTVLVQGPIDKIQSIAHTAIDSFCHAYIVARYGLKIDAVLAADDIMHLVRTLSPEQRDAIQRHVGEDTIAAACETFVERLLSSLDAKDIEDLMLGMTPEQRVLFSRCYLAYLDKCSTKEAAAQ